MQGLLFLFFLPLCLSFRLVALLLFRWTTNRILLNIFDRHLHKREPLHLESWLRRGVALRKTKSMNDDITCKNVHKIQKIPRERPTPSRSYSLHATKKYRKTSTTTKINQQNEKVRRQKNVSTRSIRNAVCVYCFLSLLGLIYSNFPYTSTCFCFVRFFSSSFACARTCSQLFKCDH